MGDLFAQSRGKPRFGGTKTLNAKRPTTPQAVFWIWAVGFPVAIASRVEHEEYVGDGEVVCTAETVFDVVTHILKLASLTICTQVIMHAFMGLCR